MHKSKVNWRDELRSYLLELKEDLKVSSASIQYWDRRMLGVYGIHVPRGRDIYQRPLCVAIALDTSGRISASDLQNFLSDTLDIIYGTGEADTLIIQTDGKVHNYEVYSTPNKLPEVIVTGKGGRDTKPTFDSIWELGWALDLLVYFTSFPMF